MALEREMTIEEEGSQGSSPMKPPKKPEIGFEKLKLKLKNQLENEDDKKVILNKTMDLYFRKYNILKEKNRRLKEALIPQIKVKVSRKPII